MCPQSSGSSRAGQDHPRKKEGRKEIVMDAFWKNLAYFSSNVNGQWFYCRGGPAVGKRKDDWFFFLNSPLPYAGCNTLERLDATTKRIKSH